MDKRAIKVEILVYVTRLDIEGANAPATPILCWGESPHNHRNNGGANVGRGKPIVLWAKPKNFDGALGAAKK